jgi:hypothetical protein
VGIQAEPFREEVEREREDTVDRHPREVVVERSWNLMVSERKSVLPCGRSELSGGEIDDET